MKYIFGKHIDALCIELLLAEPMSAARIHDTIQGIGSLQAVYKSLRQLHERGVIFKKGMLYYVDNVWRDTVADMLTTRTKIHLNPLESISYSFQSLEQLDIFWKHAQQDIGFADDISTTYYFCPHQFWIVLPTRKQSDLDFYHNFQTRKKHAQLLIGSTTTLDYTTKSMIQNPYVAVSCSGRVGLPRHTSITVAGDYVVSTRIPIKLAKQIDNIYESKIFSDEEKVTRLVRILGKKFNIKLIIENNPRRAESIGKIFKRYFL